MDYATVADKLEELKVQADVAAAELKVHESAATFDAEDFADFLQFGATLDDEALIPAFVFQVMVEEEDVLVTLNYDVRKSEPARLRIPRVRTASTWCATCKISRNSSINIGVCEGIIVLRFPRAA